jgi:hypothetical protein
MKLPTFVIALVLVSTLSVPARAQGDAQEVDFDSTEAWALKYFAAVSTFTPLRAPRLLEPWTVDLTFELDWVPYLSEEERRVGFGGTKVEDLNKLPVFARPRVLVGLPAGFAAELSWVPPVEVSGVEANLLAAAVERPLLDTATWSLGLRAYGQLGEVTGDFTCPEDAASYPPGSEQNPYGCEAPSSDTSTLDYWGVAVTAGRRVGESGDLHFALGATANDLEFQVDAITYGFHDRSHLVTDGWTYWATAGGGWWLSENLWLGGELYYSPLEVVRPPETESQNDALFNVRAGLRYRLR